MDLSICQTCGTIIRSTQNNNCVCGTIRSPHAATALANLRNSVTSVNANIKTALAECAIKRQESLVESDENTSPTQDWKANRRRAFQAKAHFLQRAAEASALEETARAHAVATNKNTSQAMVEPAHVSGASTLVSEERTASWTDTLEPSRAKVETAETPNKAVLIDSGPPPTVNKEPAEEHESTTKGWFEDDPEVVQHPPALDYSTTEESNALPTTAEIPNSKKGKRSGKNDKNGAKNSEKKGDKKGEKKTDKKAEKLANHKPSLRNPFAKMLIAKGSAPADNEPQPASAGAEKNAAPNSSQSPVKAENEQRRKGTILEKQVRLLFWKVPLSTTIICSIVFGSLTVYGIYAAVQFYAPAMFAAAPTIQIPTTLEDIGLSTVQPWLAIVAAVVVGTILLLLIWVKASSGMQGTYVPRQFRAQHKKNVAALRKPLKPGGLPLGRSFEWKPWCIGAPKDLAFSPETRAQRPHWLILGAADTGKTRLIAKMISHDITSGDRAVVVIDSDGELIDLVTRWISTQPNGTELARRVVLLDPSHKQSSLGYNPLQIPEDGDLQSTSSTVANAFKTMYSTGSQDHWGAQTTNILRNAALLLMVNGRTLSDLPALLTDPDFLNRLLSFVEGRQEERPEFPVLLETWSSYKRVTKEQWSSWTEPILNRATAMLSDVRMRDILTKPEFSLDLKRAIEQKKILLIKASRSQLEQNANLLGSVMLTGIRQAARSLAKRRDSKAPPVAVYLDDFDHFLERDTFDLIMAEANKLKLSLVAVGKTIQHLPSEFRERLIVNVNMIACFSLAKKDGDFFGPLMFRLEERRIKVNLAGIPLTSEDGGENETRKKIDTWIGNDEIRNIDRLIGQDERTFFAYQVGSVAGLYHLRAHAFDDLPDTAVKEDLIQSMYV